MSSKILLQFCAICEREKKTSNGIQKPLELSPPTADKTNIIPRHKYGNLPAKKNEDFFTQVTEPQWLRRGNLKESDFVCKRHLAVLMRGVDRGCEGGCCSPLHRGARLCKPETLKAIPPTWRRRFMKHPKIKQEDKDLMLFCWDCYKKHMNRMSKYGDPMGRSFGNKHGIQRTCSLVESDDGNFSILQAMKRYKSMDKLDSESTSPTSSTVVSPRRASSSSTSPRYNGDLLFSEKTHDHETRISPSRRTNRGRRSHRGKRSPSPPNNISPVRTSVVHSKRKHSPHKTAKSPSSRRPQTAPISAGSSINSSPIHATRLSVDDGALADTESPRSAPIPPPGLFGPKMENSDDVFDVFVRRSPKSPESNAHTTGAKSQSGESQHANPTFTSPAPLTNIERANFPENGEHSHTLETPIISMIPDDGNITWVQQDGITDTQGIEICIAQKQAEESTTSADEMADIFGNQSLNDEDDAQWMNGFEDGQPVARQTLIPEFIDIPKEIPAHHHHESSGSSSDKTGETQIEREGYTATKNTHLLGLEDKSVKQEEGVIPTNHNSQMFENEILSTHRESVDNTSLNSKPQDNSKGDEFDLQSVTGFGSISDINTSVFVSPTRQKGEDNPPDAQKRTGSYSLSPQSFRKLESMRLQFSADGTESLEPQKLYFDDGVRGRAHPMRNRVLLKVPRDAVGKQKPSFARLPAEDVEIFPDVVAFLDGITQTVGEDMAMYAQDGVQIAKVDMKLPDNRAAHKTAQFADDILIVRRGQPFEIDLELNEDYEETKHKIIVELMIGDSPRVSNNTHLFLPVRRNGTTSTKYGTQWSARCVEASGNRVKLSMTSPPTCCIGSHKLYFQIEKDGVRSRWRCGSEDDRGFIVLFNPWNIDDAVFMSSQSDRHEYVLLDTGLVYSGNKSKLIPLPWIFGQYETGVLQACVDLVESAGLSSAKQGDPVTVTKAVCRRLSEGVTNPNAPQKRSGQQNHSSAQALKRFVNSGMLYLHDDNKTLSALIVTVLRCLGLPARSVTCLDCAVETDIPMVTNFHYSEEGYSLDYMNSDKLWPSYSWTDVWMSRVDLPAGFGGWQVVLPPSEKRVSVGPIPAYGIKKGQTSCCEGTQDHFAALNADKKYWIVSQDGSMNLTKTEANFAGSMIVTKAVGNAEHQDITKLYKFSEGCDEQKLAFHTAHMHCGGQAAYEEAIEQKEVCLSLSSNPDVISFGNDVELVTKITNNTSSVRHLTVDLHGEVLAQDGSATTKLQQETILAEVLAKESVQIPVKFKLASCLHKISHDHQLAFTGFGSVKGSELKVVASFLAGMKYPDIEMQLHGEFRVGGEVTVLSRIRNPLSHVLRQAKIKLNTSGMTALDITSKSGKSVGPWQVFKCERVYRCQRAGKHTIVASFTSDLLNGPMGMQEIEIT